MENPPTGVQIYPCTDDGDRDGCDQEQGYLKAGLRQPGSEKGRKMPDAPDDANDQTGNESRMASEQSRQGESSPAQFLPQWACNNQDKRQCKEFMRGHGLDFKGGICDQVDQNPKYRNKENDQQVPDNAGSCRYKAFQQFNNRSSS